MSKFKVGDRVKCVSPDNDGYQVLNLTGTVMSIVDVGSIKIAVKWDGFNKGHSCAGTCGSTDGWYVEEHNLKKYLTFKGNK